MSYTVPIGPLVHITGISIDQLPAGAISHDAPPPAARAEGDRGAAGKSTAPPAPPAQPPALLDFLTAVLRESVPFIDSVAPKAGGAPRWHAHGSKQYAASASRVQLFKHVVPGRQLADVHPSQRRDETWFCRRSVHADAAAPKSASWAEFVRCFQREHHATEAAFTPNVVGARAAARWDTDGLEVVLDDGSRWTQLELEAVEMTHRLDAPLKNRTFPVVQVSAKLAGADEFVVVSIPLRDFARSPDSVAARDKALVVGAYAAVERVRVLPESHEIEWIMATTSDPKGILPQFVVKLAVPGQVAKDVDLFMAWIAEERKRKSEMEPVTNGRHTGEAATA